MFAQNMTLAKSNEFFEKQVWHKTYLGLEKKIKNGTKLTYFDKVFLTMINTIFNSIFLNQFLLK